MKKKANILAAALLAALLLLLFPACGHEPVTKTVLVMDTVAQLTAVDGEAGAAVDESIALLQRLDRVAGTGEESDAAHLAAAAGTGAWVEISPEVYEMLAAAQDWAARTDGAFDVTAGPLVALWGIGTDRARVPAPEEIAAARSHVGWQRLELAGDGQRARLRSPGMAIDLGGIAKGYALDAVRAIYAAHGVKNGMISLGGSSLYALGKNEHGDDWRIGIRAPRGETAQDYLGILPISDAALSSSGDYERYFEQDGQRYHHILDPRTGAPASSGLYAVTVVLRGDHAGMMSDLLTTALFVLGEEKGRALLKAAGLPATVLFISPDTTAAYRLGEALPAGGASLRNLLQKQAGNVRWEDGE